MRKKLGAAEMNSAGSRFFSLLIRRSKSGRFFEDRNQVGRLKGIAPVGEILRPPKLVSPSSWPHTFSKYKRCSPFSAQNTSRRKFSLNPRDRLRICRTLSGFSGCDRLHHKRRICLADRFSIAGIYRREFVTPLASAPPREEKLPRRTISFFGSRCAGLA